MAIRNPIIIGTRFCRLTVIGPHVLMGSPQRYGVVCRCDCGTVGPYVESQLRRHAAKSCGCLRLEMTIARSTKHGSATRSKKTRGYKVWIGIIKRCTKPNEAGWLRYGGRGIKIAEKWHSFERFISDMGEPPAGLTIERIDNNGDYCPSNCRWATRAEQARNRSSNKLITAFGQTKLLTDWATELGIPRGTIRRRLKRGLPPDLALSREDGRFRKT